MKLKKSAPLLVGILISAAIFIRIFIGEPCYISSGSMKPGILVGDWLWINKASYGSVMPNRLSDIPLINIFTWNTALRKQDMKTNWGYHRIWGWETFKPKDIIVFRSPEDSTVLLVKRIVEWLPKGTELKINTSNYERYKSILAQESLSAGNRPDFSDQNNKTGISYELQSGYCFVLGDNREISRDSRFFGYLCEKQIVGKINGILFSSSDFSRTLQKIE